MNINDNYPELFKIKDESYGKLDIDKATIIFMDGVGVTRNHKAFNMLKKDGFTYRLATSADAVLGRLYIECTYYAAMDEISFIFPNTKQLIDVMKMDNTAAYITSLFSQRFLKVFWRYYPSVLMKTTLFNLPLNEIENWIKYRKDVCHNNAPIYVAKEFLSKEEYHEKEPNEIIDVLKNHELYNEVLLKNNILYDGILKTHQKLDFSDNIFENFA